MIYYFSGTGNSKYIAERVAKQLNDRAVSIEEAPLGSVCQLSDQEPFGVVAPTYWLEVPINVREFLSELKLTASNNNYIFAIATCGGSSGAFGADIRRILQKKGMKMDATFSITMPDNWTPMFDLSDSQAVNKTNEQAETELAQILKMITQRADGNYLQGSLPYAVRYLTDPIYNQVRKTNHFTVDNTCIGCGVCEKQCPSKAIKITDGQPVWIKKQCIICLRCLHHCPKFSIQYGKKTREHGQYRNPHTTI